MALVEGARVDIATEQGVPLVHQMLVLDAFLRRRLDQDRYESITRAFVADLLEALRMEPLGDLGIFPAVDLREPGWSFIQPITTSHVSAHYFTSPGGRPHIRFDAYSCASIDRGKLIGVCHDHFRLSAWRASFIDREVEPLAPRRVVELAGVGARIVSETTLSSPAADRPAC